MPSGAVGGFWPNVCSSREYSRRPSVVAFRFRDRKDAGHRLAARLAAYASRPDVVVLALPRGGLPVAYEVAHALGAPLDVFLVRKLGMPGHEEFAIGAIASGGVLVLNEETVRDYGVRRDQVEAIVDAEKQELERRERSYRGDRPFPDLAGRTVILIDDGLATGSTMRAAVAALRQERPARVIVAVPTAPPETCDEMRAIVDEMICLITPEPFYAVGLWYEDFSQTSDEEVRELLERAAAEKRAAARP
jgi:putative phosphoribosyl transferase